MPLVPPKQVKLTAKGDLLVRDSAKTTRLAVGTDGQVLQADSTQAEGVKWGAAGSGVRSSIFAHFAPTLNNQLNLLGWHIKTDAAKALSSASPLTVAVPGYDSHVVVDVSAASGLPFTIRITGTSIDESTGILSPSDTEDLDVTANGFYRSVKSWVTAVQLSIVEASKSCTVDAIRTSYWDAGNKDFTVLGCRMEFVPDSTTWSINLQVLHLLTNGDVFTIDDATLANTDSPPRAAKGERGKYKRYDYNRSISGSGAEGIIVFVNQKSINNFFVEVKYSVK